DGSSRPQSSVPGPRSSGFGRLGMGTDLLERLLGGGDRSAGLRAPAQSDEGPLQRGERRQHVVFGDIAQVADAEEAVLVGALTAGDHDTGALPHPTAQLARLDPFGRADGGERRARVAGISEKREADRLSSPTRGLREPGMAAE